MIMALIRKVAKIKKKMKMTRKRARREITPKMRIRSKMEVETIAPLIKRTTMKMKTLRIKNVSK